MADDNSARYRSSDSPSRGPAQAAPANDPLAELARLIGQNDAFAGYGRVAHPPAPAQPDPAAHYTGDPLPSFLSHPAPQYGDDPAPPVLTNPNQQPYAGEPALRYSEPAAQQYGHDDASRYNSDFPAHNDWPGQPAPAPSYPPQHPSAPAPAYDSQRYAGPGYAGQSYSGQTYADPNYANPGYADPRSRPGEGYPPHQSGVDAAGYPLSPERQGYGSPLYPHEPEAGGMPPPHDDEFYDDEPRGGRRRGLLTVVAVLGLAVVGTAGAFGYRSLFGGAGTSGPPPVIRASGEPSKVAPPPATVDPSASKFSYDRFGDAGKDEQVVRREEKPVDLSRAAAPPPRTILPGAPAPNSSPAKQGSAAVTAANPPSAMGEPRRVRTVPIRPDQADAAPAVPPVQSAVPMSVAPPRQASVAASASAADEAAPRAAAPRASSRMALRSAPAAAPAPVANAPLSLSPDANNALPPPSAPQSASPSAPRATPAPTRLASAPASGGGSYLVQVSSQRSEADAESAYRGISSKFSSVLGSHPHTVRRADLGSKGVYYRAMVGPFGSREEAVQLCSSLKQAGGDCVVQH